MKTLILLSIFIIATSAFEFNSTIAPVITRELNETIASREVKNETLIERTLLDDDEEVIDEREIMLNGTVKRHGGGFYRRPYYRPHYRPYQRPYHRPYHGHHWKRNATILNEVVVRDLNETMTVLREIFNSSEITGKELNESLTVVREILNSSGIFAKDLSSNVTLRDVDLVLNRTARHFGLGWGGFGGLRRGWGGFYGGYYNPYRFYGGWNNYYYPYSYYGYRYYKRDLNETVVDEREAVLNGTKIDVLRDLNETLTVLREILNQTDIIPKDLSGNVTLREIEDALNRSARHFGWNNYRYNGYRGGYNGYGFRGYYRNPYRYGYGYGYYKRELNETITERESNDTLLNSTQIDSMILRDLNETLVVLREILNSTGIIEKDLSENVTLTDIDLAMNRTVRHFGWGWSGYRRRLGGYYGGWRSFYNPYRWNYGYGYYKRDLNETVVEPELTSTEHIKPVLRDLFINGTIVEGDLMTTTIIMKRNATLL